MRRANTAYKAVILILSLIIIIQWAALIRIRPKPPPDIIPPAIKGKIAIVLDDWGYNLHNLQLLKQVKCPLTVAVLPNLNYSKSAATQLYQSGFEVILHLPMEPYSREKVKLEKNTILVSTDEKTIKNIISEGLKNVPYVKGVSNHMGSKATENAGVMTAVFKELKKRRLYFLDSFVSDNSVCLDLAHKAGISFVRRDIFLDNKSDPEYIKGQIYKLKTRARIYGQAVGIGHDRKTTIEVLREMMPKLAKEGYKFVFVSELAK